MSQAPSLHQALITFAAQCADVIELSPSAAEREAAKPLESQARRAIVKLSRETDEPLALGPNELKAHTALVTELSRPECPACHSTDVYETKVETREIVAGEMVTMRGTAFDCIDCHHTWEAEEEV